MARWSPARWSNEQLVVVGALLTLSSLGLLALYWWEWVTAFASSIVAVGFLIALRQLGPHWTNLKRQGETATFRSSSKWAVDGKALR